MDAVRYVFAESGIVSLLLALCVSFLVGAIAYALNGRVLRDALKAFMVVLPVALIAGSSLARYGWPTELAWSGAFYWTPDGWLRFSTYFVYSSEIMLNMLLFALAGVIWVVTLRRPWLTLIALALLSVGIETIQAIAGVGLPDASDLFANLIGAFAGVTFGSMMVVIRERGASAMLRPMIVLLAVALVLVALVPLGAAQRQQRVMDLAEEKFSGSTLTDYRQWSDSDDPSGDPFALDRFFFSSGTLASDEAVSVRFDSSFMGLTRCVVVTWTEDDVAILKRSGGTCREFWG